MTADRALGASGFLPGNGSGGWANHESEDGQNQHTEVSYPSESRTR